MLRLRTFGGLTLEKDGVRLDEIVAQRKVLALLAVLARSGRKGMGRERLMVLLWPDSDTDRARGALNQMLHTLRRQLAPDVVDGTAELRLNSDAVSSDVSEFTDLLARGRPEEAVELYQGPFLDGVHIERAPDFSRWQDTERAGLERAYIDALETLARSAHDAGWYDDAVKWSLRCLAVDPLRARSVIGVMDALDLAGDRAGALRHAKVHEDLLRDELGAQPDPDVTALATRMRASAPRRNGHEENVTGTTELPELSLPAVVEEPVVRSTVPVDVGENPRVRPSLFRRGWLIAGIPVVLLLAAALLPGALARSERETGADSRRVVVAVFANQTGDSSLNPLQLVAADWITRGIVATPGIDMLFPGVLHSQGRAAWGVPTTPLELARSNGAHVAISGNFYRSGDSLYFAATLIDVASGRVIRGIGPFPANVSQPLDGIEELRQAVSVALASMLDDRVSSFVSTTASLPRLDAYREFLIGEELLWRGKHLESLPHFAKAGELDSSFLQVAARMAVTAANAGRCDIVDSIAIATARRQPPLSEREASFVAGSVARCSGDIEEVIRLTRQRLAHEPRQPLFKWTLAAALRSANRPSEAAKILASLDPEHDLGWLAGQQRLFYWREFVNAQHATGDYRGEWKNADVIGRASPGPVMGYYFKGRSFAGRNDAGAALRMVDSMQAVPGGPVTVGTANGTQIIRAATTGWTMYGMSEELLAHGHPDESRAVALRVIQWVDGRTTEEKTEPEYRLILARSSLMTGDYERAYTVLSDLVKADSNNVEYLAAFGRAAALRGDGAMARRASVSLAQVPTRNIAGVPGRNGAAARTLGRAQIAAALGDTTGALALLDSVTSRTYPTDFLLLHSDPAFASLHGNRRFKALIRPKG
ncbi:MAG: BTAD domain-containing putative transcriptional regulator [Gemmatimonadaceae bacterium]